MFSWEFSEYFLNQIAPLALNTEDIEFLFNRYIPILKDSLKDMKTDFFFFRTYHILFGVSIKLVYAFAF
jgi:hypothetical protein